ncbi:MAG: DUF3726 domain-containing protein [Marivibrio sp.]|uniref:DUF3726 domain-containing protein n=1 Tax=Marivibrio sp. TaxID=2039719 RepID=UPI0032ECA0C4
MPRASLNEVEALARKAARGAGMSWGLAEETGKAVRWLALYGLPSLAPLVDLLAAQDGADYADLRPIETLEGDGRAVWRASGGALCPIAAGAALADLAAPIAEGRETLLVQLREPVLLLPFVARAARYEGEAFAVEAAGVHAALGPGGPAPFDAALAAARGPVDVTVHAEAEAPAPQPEPGVGGVAAPGDLWRRADAFAHRTYVPASEASRLSGAGAGTSDND